MYNAFQQEGRQSHMASYDKTKCRCCFVEYTVEQDAMIVFQSNSSSPRSPIMGTPSFYNETVSSPDTRFVTMLMCRLLNIADCQGLASGIQ